MSIILEDFDAEVIWQNLLFWMRSILQLINSKPNDTFLDLILRCIPKLLKLSLEFDDLSREISLNIIHPLLNNLLQNTGTKSRCLINKIAVCKECITCYPGPTGRFRLQIENLCLALLSSREQPLRKKACECMALLPRCGSSGEKGTKFAEIWNKQFVMTTDTLNVLLAELFHTNAGKDASKDRNTRTFRFTPVSLAEPEYSTITSIRIKSLLFVIEQMLSYKFPTMIQIDVGIILHICSRLFDEEVDVTYTSIEAVCLNAVLPQLWHSVLSLINVLLAQMGSLMIPFEALIFQMAYQVLTNHREGEDRRYQNITLKRQGYQLLDSWNMIVGPLSSKMLQKIVNVILHDVKPHLQTNRLKEIKNGGKQKKNKDRSKLQEEIVKGEMALKKIDDTEGSEIAYAALTLLATVINKSGPVMEADLMLRIETEVISICNMLMGPSKQLGHIFPPPYGNDKCRKKLLACTFWLTNLYHHHIPTPLSTLIRIFQDFCKDPSPIVSQDSNVYLSLLDKVIHPSVPALREYHEDSFVNSTKPQTHTNTPLLSTGLFDELHLASQQETTKTQDIGGGSHEEAPVYPTVATNVFSEGATSPQTTEERFIDNNAKSCSIEKLSNNGNTLQLEPTGLEERTITQEKSVEVQGGTEKSLDEKRFDLKSQFNEDETDRDVEMEETLAKRPKLDEEMCEREEENNLCEPRVLNNASGPHGTKQNNFELMEATSNKDVVELPSKSDDESTMFLKSFVNSFPDSE